MHTLSPVSISIYKATDVIEYMRRSTVNNDD